MTEIVVEDSAFLHIVISLGILLFTAKVFAEIFHKLKLPVVLGELLAGIIVGPFALGAFISFDGKPIVNLDETVKHIGELSAIVILFIAGLEITPREFLKGGIASFTIGSIGVVVPFFVGYFTFTMFGIHALQSMLIATALTATSIAISIQVLTELGKMQTKEARLILGARYCRRYSCNRRPVSSYNNGSNWKYDTRNYRCHIPNPKDIRLIRCALDRSSITSAKTTTCRKTLEVKR